MKTPILIASLFAAACHGSQALPSSNPMPVPPNMPPAPSGLAPACEVTADPCPTLVTYPSNLVGWVQTTTTFRATVTALNATSPDPVNQDPSRQVFVRIEAAWPGGAFLNQFIGLDNEVMVVMQSAPTFGVGYRGFFFANEVAVGQMVDLVEVAHEDVSANLDGPIGDIESRTADAKLWTQLSSAEIIVEGDVAAVAQLPLIDQGSEHSPVWYEGDTDVSCALRGAPASTIPIRFNASGDITATGEPRLAVGDHAIYSVSTDTTTGEAGFGYLAIDPLAVQPMTGLQHVVDIMSCPSPAP
jgi:hypothetical protein